MSTAKNKTGHGAAWANLVICGGLSWGVNLWHATHTTGTSAHVGAGLALLCATGPVVSAGFASHNMARSGGGSFKKAMTYLVFAMGMALSITAQAEAVQGVFGNIGFGVTFALMLDLSAFMSLHSIMTTPAAAASADASNGHGSERPAERPRGAVVDTPADASTRVSMDTPADARRTPPAERPRTPAKTARRTPPAAARSTAVDTRAKARELLKANPDMNGNELAAALKRKPAGSIRTMRGELLEELRDAGELPSVRALGA
jgi:hypothetical protein